MSPELIKPTLWGILATFMWSLSAVLLAFSGNVPPFQVSAMSFFIGFLFIFAEQIYSGKDLKERWVRPLSDYLFVLQGLVGGIILYYYALKTAPIFEANVINYLWPILLAFFLKKIQHEHVSIKQILGLILGFSGCALLFISRSQEPMFDSFEPGFIAAFIATLSWSYYSAKAKSRSYPVGFMVPIFLILALISLALHLIFEDTVMPQKISEWAAIIMLGAIRFSLLLWDYGIKYGNRMLLVSMSYFIPIPSFFFLYIAGFGPHSPYILLSATLVIVGIFIANWDDIKKFKQALA